MAQALVRNRTDDPVPAVYAGGAPLAVASTRQQPARRHRPPPHRARPAAGANGFLLKDTLAEEILATVRAALLTEGMVAPSLTRRLVERLDLVHAVVFAYESGPVRAVPGSSSRRMRSYSAAISGVARMSSRSAETSWSMSSTERTASS